MSEEVINKIIINGDFGDIDPEFTTKFENTNFQNLSKEEIEELKNYILSQKEEVIIYFIVSLLDTCTFVGLNEIQYDDSVKDILSDKRLSKYMEIIHNKIIISDPNREIIINFIKKNNNPEGWCELSKIGNYLKNMKIKLNVSLTEYLEDCFFSNEIEISIDKNTGIRKCRLNF